MKRVIALIMVLAMLVALAGCGANNGSKDTSEGALPSVIKIGAPCAISGTYATEGRYVKNALELLKKEVNDAGGVDFHGTKIPIDFVYEDTEAKPEVTVNVYNKMVNDEKVMAVVGPPMSGCLLASGSIAQNAGIPNIASNATNVKCTEIGDYIFRVCFIDSFQAKVAATYLYNDMGYRKVAILFNNAEDYSTGLATEFKKDFTRLGGTIVEEQSYAGYDITDYNAQLSKVKSANPEAVFCPVMYMAVPLILSQARQMGLKCDFLGTDGWDTQEILQYAGKEALVGAKYVSGYSADNPDPVSAAFTKKYRDTYQGDPNSNAVMSYDAALLMIDAIKRSASLKGSDIRDAIAATKDFQGVTGTINFDENRNPIKDALIIGFNDKLETHYVATVKAADMK